MIGSVSGNAKANVLQLISRSTFDLDVVLRTLAENATTLCGADFGVFFRPDGSGNFPAVAHHCMPPAFMATMAAKPIRAGDGSLIGRAILEKRVLQMEDLHTDPSYRQDQARAATFTPC